ncbi:MULTISPECIES: aminotransferase class I/II-fold pyridoxal phosphate-dependent enzyme [unclassified Methanoculleus]|uniref:aminotransferase class I/II-fold pyridoxal phosphate-dependent enzyme n=1 Tax=unclassified Methanoculleus TaxID=2619537 RepID=UPI0025DF8C57|nr:MULTISPECIES: aminotransferase class I/II-fold pyridoxal phosphate-dependent enzyme [unclassified Methanoculleus]MCK9319611.1 aminotransferase class I/II-fold pyridoxal phosphate-dependent enzyme [Methanoculleus sp.]MDD2252925.1 aminotransferase class I/II-fold pyridoxal phosphate-dependent enzyme [Methanoculleus sp.]MDD2786973.1 aminotransferase class I/II-fold pyridoxal phosphate-dependent enzyme [Methanoculleus sp.]MDD3217264.1 aminotransferase class I/II-fold pyridoxal phosphate-dependen
MRDFVSARARAIPPSGIRKFFDIAQTMEDVISLGVGEPDFVTPWCVCEASIYSIEQGSTAYTSNKGTPQLRGAISRYLDTRFRTRYDAEDEIIVTCGVSEAADIAIRAVTDPGDEVLVAEPCYVSYTPCVSLAGGVPVPVRCRADDEFRLTADALAESITRKTKALIANFPNNPTGGVMQEADWRAIADLLVDHDLLLISDEVYGELTYDGDHFSPARLPELRERTITLNGFSKAFAMTGWRIGYLCAPPEITAAALKIHQYVALCAPVMGQIAAYEALRIGEAEKDAMVREYRLRRNLFVDGLNKLGLACHLPKGAFYAFPSVESTGMTDTEFAESLLREQHVAVVPGSVLGPSGAGHVRCAYAVSRDDLKEAISRIGAFLDSVK